MSEKPSDFNTEMVDQLKGLDIVAQGSRAQSQNPHVNRYASLVWAARWPTTTIYVCWEGEVDAEAARWTREAVNETWERESALVFKGWEKCAPVNSGIRIAVRDVGPHVTSLGRFLDRKQNGMVLNFTFENWMKQCKVTREHCIKAIAVHEFGHGIGLTHEQNRPDTPGECNQRSGTAPDTLLTPYDPSSVMNYCNKSWNNDGMLSVLDISAVQELYPKK